MIYRLRYCNKEGVEARVDIQKGLATPVIEIEGTERPFVLSYNNDKGDKSGMFLSSSADIEIYETTDFNIDNLKTSNETELSVTHYIDNVISWQGFIIPDFFSIEVRNNPVIAMTASDRIGTLKSVTLSDLPSMISLRELAILCLNKTGLELPLRTMADFNNGTGVNDFFNSKILTQRLSDTKGRSISCYDILSSILTASNSFLVQRAGGWHIINKIQHEAGSGKLYTGATSFINWSDVIFNFSDISVGGRRAIIPVASTVGVFHEFGGGRLHPDNYDFSLDLTGWNPVGGFVATIDNRSVDTFTTGGSGGAVISPVYGGATEKKYLVNNNQYVRNVNPVYLESDPIPIFYKGSGAVNISLDINAVGPSSSSAYIRVAIIATNGTDTKILDYSGNFIDYPDINPPVFTAQFNDELAIAPTILKALSKGLAVSGKLEVEDDLSLYSLKIRLYGGGGGRYVLINSASVIVKSGANDNAKGIIYKVEREDNYTKAHEINTSLFADYLTTGLNGYFYDYSIDDTSSLYNSANELTSKWTAYNDPEQLPLLQHITRQRSRLFSVAHDLLSAEIEVNNFDPLAIFVACEKRYTVVSAQFDFFKSNLSVELEEVAFQNANVRDYIYSYFGDGEEGIKSIGGISGGSGGGGVDLGIIGGINDRIDEVGQKMDDIKVGVSNLLRNTGFLGDFNSLEVDALTAVLENTQIGTNPLVHWVHNNTDVIDAPSRSGKGVRIGSLQQNVDLRAGEAYVLSFMAKGASLMVNLVDDIEVELTNEFKRYSFDIVSPNTGSFIFWITDPSLSSEVYEIMLSEGNTDVDYAYAAEDDLKAISQLQAINAITSVIKDYDTDILGGLILTSMIQLGKYKDGKMEEVNAGISGIYNNDDDPATWFGGNLEKAIRTVQRIKSNPYSVSEEEWEDMANIVFTHGGDGFFKGIIYALGGIFRGRIESNSDGNRIIIDPSTRSLKAIDDNDRVRFEISFNSEEPSVTTELTLNTYTEEGALAMKTTLRALGLKIQTYVGTPLYGAEFNADGLSFRIYNGDPSDPDDVLMNFSLSRNSIGGFTQLVVTGLPSDPDVLPKGGAYVDYNGNLKIKK